MRLLITGATGFVGSQILETLMNQDYLINILVHKTIPTNLTQHNEIKVFTGDITNIADLETAATDVDCIINCVGIIRETKHAKFEEMHIKTVENIVNIIKKKNINQLIHISALGVGENIPTKYFESKEKAEEIIKSAKINYVILRPSLIWGEGGLKKEITKLIKIPLFTPIIGSGQYKFQPIALTDLSEIINLIIQNYSYFVNKSYDLGGPNIYTFENLISEVEKSMNKKKFHIHVTLSLLKPLSIAMTKLGLPMPITPDQIKMIECENVAKKNAAEKILQHKPSQIFN